MTGLQAIRQWLDRVDPGVHRRIKGLRLVTAYALAAMLGRIPELMNGLPDGASLSSLAAGFALWASVSEAQATRFESSRDLLILCIDAAVGAIAFIALAPALTAAGRTGPELTLATGAFCVAYLKRFGVLGAGIGSQIFIGQLLAYGAGLNAQDLGLVGIAAAIASVAAMVPRILSGPAEHPVMVPPPTRSDSPAGLSPELIAGLQAALAALVIVALNDMVSLTESAWAVTACTYVIANSPAETVTRVWRRILGTAIGVPLALACLPIAADAPLLVWAAAALAMVIYAMALPERYDIACGAYAYALIVTLAAGGEHSILLLAARAWETLIGGVLGLGAALLAGPVLARLYSSSGG
ncbi:MAG TPA: FUSC family protein [Stellaceae bacterium]|nr:FUSC family protein [Stellaceae bacterium]